MTKILTKPLKRVPFFEIGNHKFTIVEKVHKSVALQIMHEIRRVGYEAVLPAMFEKCLGKDGYEQLLAILDEGEIDDVDFDWIQKEVETKVMGAVEGLGEASGPDTNKSAGSSTTKRT